jgi:hypothetical protein
MIEMIGNFSYNYELDVFMDENNILLDVDYNDNKKVFNVRFERYDGERTDPCEEDVLRKDFQAKDYSELEEKLKAFFLTEEYTSWRIKQLGWPEPPKIPNEQKIKELIANSNSVELKYLENKTSALEEEQKKMKERIDVLEDSVEDLQKWRHGC